MCRDGAAWGKFSGMGVILWFSRIAVLLAGGGLVAYGSYVLATGRVPDRSRASFRSAHDAGMYPLCSGIGLMCLVAGQFASDAKSFSVALTFGALILAMVFMGLAFVRYRPRRSSSHP